MKLRTSAAPTRRLKLINALIAAGLAMLTLNAEANLKIVDGTLQEANGKPFVMRGVNAAHVWYRDKTPQTLKDISARGANTVRLVLGMGVKWTKTDEAEVKSLIEQAKAQKLIAVLEVHDATGYGEQSGMATLDQAADYWVGIKNALIGQEDYVIVNIANEPLGNGQAASLWIDGHKNAIAKIRAAGIKNTLMVDAANWGQDWQGIMRQNAASVLASDPLKNTIFSIHMYAVYSSDSTVNDYLTSFINAKLPIVVGEFGNAFQGQPVAASAIMSRAQQYGIGYIGWSWSGNGGSDAPLDLVNNFDGNSLSAWGKLLFNDTHGITATAKTATIFGGVTPPPAVPTMPNVVATAGDAKITLNWSAQKNVTSYSLSRASAANGTYSALATLDGSATSYVDSGLKNDTTYYYKITATNPVGKSPVASVSATPKSSGGKAACTVTIDSSSDWGNGQVLRVVVANQGSSPISGWSLAFTESSDFRIESSWNASFAKSGRTLTVTPANWASTVSPSGNAEAGMQISYSGSRPVPGSASVSGAHCAVLIK